MKQIFVAFIMLSVIFCACKKDNKGDNIDDAKITSAEDLKINQMQVIASHNSYRKKTYQPLFDFLLTLDILPANLSPESWDYEHLPFDQQFNNYNVRGLEIDISPDPNGGYYYNRGGNDFVSEPIESGIPQLQEPGFKVFHVADLDYETHYYTFVEALQAIKQWSDAHPNHLPLFINVETKSSTPGDILPFQNFVKSLPYTAQFANDIDVEIKSVFGNNLDKVITPDKVRGDSTTLEAAVLAGGWPKISEARGKIILIMEGGMKDVYIEGHESLKDRAMFVYASPGTPEAAFVISNGAKSQEATITQRVKEGYIVRTRSDADTNEARSGDVTSREAAFRSGAQIISTDYYKPDSRAGQPGWTDFSVQFSGGALARVNPVSAEGYQSFGNITE
jgi:hypothetical protein